MSETKDLPLDERVRMFNCLELPGQGMGMHMGTFYLVSDLWHEVKRLRDLRHTDQSVPCPTCGFHVVKTERPPFQFED